MHAPSQVTGLLPSTTYQLRVRAHSAGGWGLLSPAITASTSLPLQRPPPPVKAPTLLGSTCTSLSLSVPQLRPGCSGEQWFIIQWKAGSKLPSKQSSKSHPASGVEAGWHTYTAPDAGGGPGRERVEGGSTLTLEDLDPAVAYEVRAIAHNEIGPSGPGPSSGPLALGVSSIAMISAPRAQPTSVGSVHLGWAGRESDCRPKQTWEVLVQRLTAPSAPTGGGAGVGGGGGDGGGGGGSSEAPWKTLASGVEGSSYDAHSMRCLVGCRFIRVVIQW